MAAVPALEAIEAMSLTQLGNLITVPYCGSCSTGRTDAPLVGVERPGRMKAAPNTVPPTKMASNPTPREGESAVGSIDWESLGRRLLVETMEYRGDRLRSEWVEIASKAKKGEEVTRRDWIELSRELEQFAHLVDELEEVTRGSEE